MHYVYILQSLSDTTQIYIGCTENLESRLEFHNKSGTTHTSKFKPWEVVVYLGLKNKSCAIELEKYLKSGSGRAFIKTRLL